MGTKGSGDRLARGNTSATWGPLNVSQDKWDMALGAPEPKKPKRKKRPKKEKS
jgi:hypothetical protein